MSNYNMAFTEIYEVFKILNTTDYNKIPLNVIKAISENRDENYNYKKNEYGEIDIQSLLPETKAILYNFYRDYWTTKEKREEIIANQRQERIKNEKEKKQKYNESKTNIRIFDTSIKEECVETTDLVKYKKTNIIQRILEFFRSKGPG